jgi:hypothetical protein
MREVYGGAKRAKHRAKRSPEYTDPKRSVGARPNIDYRISFGQGLKKIRLFKIGGVFFFIYYRPRYSLISAYSTSGLNGLVM